jgi:hypothetical protein
MFPGTSDPYGWGTNGAITASNFPACWNWSEETALDLGGDRRFMQSAGPFTFLPGAVQNITTAAVWARASSGGRLASVAKLLAADDDMKILAGNCWNVTPFIFATDAGIASIISPPGDTLCDSVFTPMVRLQNFGSTILTSATINYQLDGNPVQTVPWSGSLAWLDTADILLPVFSTTAGAHTFTAYTTNPNSSPDQHTVNDTIRIDFLINTGLLLPLTEGFETGTFPPANWTVSYINTYHLGLSRFLSGGFGNSTASMRAFCYGRTISSNVDFTSTGLNIDGLFAPADMTFSLAYAQRSDTSADTLQIYISIDCGSTFTLAYSKTGTALATTINHATGYLPLATDWRTDTVDLAPYLGQPHLMVKFRFLSGNSQHPGNNIYVDDINIIAAPLAVNALNPGNAMHVYPNPAKDNFIIQLNENLSNAELEIFNIMGEAVLQSKINQRLTTISTKDLAPGIYFVKVGDGKNAFIQKLVIE